MCETGVNYLSLYYYIIIIIIITIITFFFCVNAKTHILRLKNVRH
jgi:hypothetical protein